jgi:hypothetical protein
MMKGFFYFSKEIYLHMKNKSLISKIEKYFNFFKMDKKNVQKKKLEYFMENS